MTSRRADEDAQPEKMNVEKPDECGSGEWVRAFYCKESIFIFIFNFLYT